MANFLDLTGLQRFYSKLQDVFIKKPATGTIEIVNTNALASGYIRYDSGLQICWGTGDPTGNPQFSEPVNFPVPFLQPPAMATSCSPFGCWDVTETNFKFSVTSTGVNPSWTVEITWMAIGRWK